MKQMTIKLVTNFRYDGKQMEIAEEIKELISDPPERKDSTNISNIVKKMFEEELFRTVVVKTRIKNDSVLISVNIRPGPDDE